MKRKFESETMNLSPNGRYLRHHHIRVLMPGREQLHIELLLGKSVNQGTAGQAHGAHAHGDQDHGGQDQAQHDRPEHTDRQDNLGDTGMGSTFHAEFSSDSHDLAYKCLQAIMDQNVAIAKYRMDGNRELEKKMVDTIRHVIYIFLFYFLFMAVASYFFGFGPQTKTPDTGICQNPFARSISEKYAAACNTPASNSSTTGGGIW
ncbi:unnamed protein product [Lymnaea stagnalis]|uniref:Uncharacterized protein n=1 Tax=Lymnaea stagnalis TaxID=6523 RepID=A0AAV2HUF6_LYMST